MVSESLTPRKTSGVLPSLRPRSRKSYIHKVVSTSYVDIYFMSTKRESCELCKTMCKVRKPVFEYVSEYCRYLLNGMRYNHAVQCKIKKKSSPPELWGFTDPWPKKAVGPLQISRPVTCMLETDVDQKIDM
uniref:Uncharacterized protein n=1 Tax=Romanomermis culicivorax TaxID=13658 RepID=A0A915K543_ROMCU